MHCYSALFMSRRVNPASLVIPLQSSLSHDKYRSAFCSRCRTEPAYLVGPTVPQVAVCTYHVRLSPYRTQQWMQWSSITRWTRARAYQSAEPPAAFSLACSGFRRCKSDWIMCMHAGWAVASDRISWYLSVAFPTNILTKADVFIPARRYCVIFIILYFISQDFVRYVTKAMCFAYEVRYSVDWRDNLASWYSW